MARDNGDGASYLPLLMPAVGTLVENFVDLAVDREQVPFPTARERREQALPCVRANGEHEVSWLLSVLGLWLLC